MQTSEPENSKDKVRTLRASAGLTLCTNQGALDRASRCLKIIQGWHVTPNDNHPECAGQDPDETFNALATLLIIRTAEREHPGTFQRIVDELFPAKAGEPQEELTP